MSATKLSLPVHSPLFLNPEVSYVVGIKTLEKEYALRTKCAETVISSSKLQRNPFSKDESNGAIKRENSRIQIGGDPLKRLLAGKVG